MEDETNKQIDNWKRKAMIDLRRKIVAKALAAASDDTSMEDFRAILFLLDAVLEEIDLGGET